MPPLVDLRSDTQTRPSAGMRQAMADAAVGDEQLGEDPSVNRLCERVADLLGYEAAVLMPSGTMCNLVACSVVCQPGDEVIASGFAHIVNSECGGLAAIARAMPRLVEGERGLFSGRAVDAAVRPPKRHAPRARMVSIEQTVNRCGGSVWPLDALRDVAAASQRHHLHAHIDGARLLNASTALGVAPACITLGFQSAWLDLSKGLGCPVGAVLAGSQAFIDEAWRWKQRLGGAMRQAGILAAAGLYALDHNIDRLAEDHANAALLADAVRNIAGLRLLHEPVETNMVFIDLAAIGWTAAAAVGWLEERGIRIGVDTETTLRAVTHMDVDQAGVLKAADALAALACDAAGQARSAHV